MLPLPSLSVPPLCYKFLFSWSVYIYASMYMYVWFLYEQYITLCQSLIPQLAALSVI